MISAYTGTQIREAERPLLDTGMGAVLMQRAAYGLANAVVRELRARGHRLYGASVTVLAGKGNNGGDGLFAAAMLAGRGMRTTAVLTAGEAHSEGLAAFEKAGGRVFRLTAENAGEAAAAAARTGVVIDAVLGTGAQGGLRGPAAALMEALGRSRPGLVVACDIPSGVDAGTGEAHLPVLGADLTVTFGAAKAGLLADPGADFAGRVEVVPIGIEAGLPQPALRRLEAADLSALLPHPGRRSHKYSRGVLGVVAGSSRYPGAAVLACRGALAAGVGMVRYLGPPDVADLVRQTCPEVVCGTGSPADAHVQAWLLGPGLDEEAQQQLDRVREAAATGLPVVADAGALPALPLRLDPRTVLTPHAGELATLLGRYGANPERGSVEDATLAAARQASDLTGATVLLKGATTLVAAPSGAVFSQAEASPWMASAGSGDVLAGVLGSLLAQLAETADAFSARGIPGPDRWAAVAAMAASLHGRAGSLASGGGPLTASAIAESLPEVMTRL
ncbi:bifunctional ADP-dependent NAD(P)H-hydrate dehydratase/NAD(P)H-hydrate epimerase [Arthrobacter sp. EPSL27]|uniref:bifunctional ADP-dependent NAD(P)H-hydrate dehydratase/NAD(P)H-hydrate epimerase n=1 Tax=Arthrobacter sp. EPSL27 TaxID=1745378 RepID=UPI0007478153|nr:bifunctional ADP-dependent NAD(P)H-hydrate dehydratase/NAD(P)H-hydrate epimerase [Arthrobacter sp. EPSL27]KUM32715.1 bifunctional ADP-dependent (S)-NAD(P)H-hydrate dehydratase/NAD(P)H-hydrate epimerase [Arthrobacter sp. EPSL27]